MRLPAHEHEVPALAAVSQRRICDEVPQENRRLRPVGAARSVLDHVVSCSSSFFSVPEIWMHRWLRFSCSGYLIVGRSRCRRAWYLRGCCRRACCLWVRRWARTKHAGQNGRRSILAAIVCPSRVADLRCEAEVLLEDDEESVFIKPRVRAKLQQDVLTTKRATTSSLHWLPYCHRTAIVLRVSGGGLRGLL